MAIDEEHRSEPAWDRLGEREAAKLPAAEARGEAPRAVVDDRLLLPLFAAAWADIVCVVAVCTSSLLALVIMGHHARMTTLPWSMALGILWWGAAATVTIVVRRGTPGMLMAGVVAADTVAARRVPAMLLAALINSALLGLPALTGRRKSLIRVAAGQELVAAEPS